MFLGEGFTYHISHNLFGDTGRTINHSILITCIMGGWGEKEMQKQIRAQDKELPVFYTQTLLNELMD